VKFSVSLKKVNIFVPVFCRGVCGCVGGGGGGGQALPHSASYDRCGVKALDYHSYVHHQLKSE